MQALLALVSTLTTMALPVESNDNRLALTLPTWNLRPGMGKANVVELVKAPSSSISSLPPANCPAEEACNDYGACNDYEGVRARARAHTTEFARGHPHRCRTGVQAHTITLAMHASAHACTLT